MLRIPLEKILEFQDFLLKGANTFLRNRQMTFSLCILLIRNFLSDLTPPVDDESAVDPQKLPLSPSGVLSLLALAIYSYTVAHPAKDDVTPNLLPVVLNPIWIARKVVIIAEPLLSMYVFSAQKCNTLLIEKMILVAVIV